MKTLAEKRKCDRLSYSVPAVISYFNKNDLFDARTLNHCSEGLCFQSNCSLHPGATLYIRIKEFHPDGPCTGVCQGLHTNILAEVKWCQEIPVNGTSCYKAGVKYYGPIY